MSMTPDSILEGIVIVLFLWWLLSLLFVSRFRSKPKEKTNPKDENERQIGDSEGKKIPLRRHKYFVKINEKSCIIGLSKILEGLPIRIFITDPQIDLS